MSWAGEKTLGERSGGKAEEELHQDHPGRCQPVQKDEKYKKIACTLS